VVYRNDPGFAFYGVYIFADYQLNKLQAFKLNAAKNGVTDLKSISGPPPGRISTIGQDAAGNIYVATYLEFPDSSRTHVYRLKHAEPRPVSVALRPGRRISAGDRLAILDVQGHRIYDLAGRPIDAPHRGIKFGMFLVRDEATGGVRKVIDLR
jgi:hypothetical protein